MTLPSSGPIDVAAINTEIGLPNTLSSTLSFLNGYLKSPAESPNLGAFFGTAYYQRNVDGNCNNGNCSNSGSGNGNCTAVIVPDNGNCAIGGGPNGNCNINCNCGNIQCHNCTIAGPSDCTNCAVCFPQQPYAPYFGQINCTVCTPINCADCSVCSGINCTNCDSQQYLQPNCNCSGGYNCTTSGVSYNCTTSTYSVNCVGYGVVYNCLANPTTYNCNCACNCSKIICAKLYEFGLMDNNIWAADQAYGQWLRKNDRKLYRGYVRWARIVTAWMDGKGPDFMVWIKDPKERAIRQKAAITDMAIKIGTPWSEHMAWLMGEMKNDNTMGRILMRIGTPISKFVDMLPRPKVRREERKHSLATLYTMWALFYFSYYTSLIIVNVLNKISSWKKIFLFKLKKQSNV